MLNHLHLVLMRAQKEGTHSVRPRAHELYTSAILLLLLIDSLLFIFSQLIARILLAFALWATKRSCLLITLSAQARRRLDIRDRAHARSLAHGLVR